MTNLQGKKYCYFVMQTKKTIDDQIMILVAIEGQTGYFLTDLTYGTDFLRAEAYVNGLNAKLGISEHDAMIIQCGTMKRPSNG